jgi:UDP-N-acetylmuramoylalanine--D-glutamate ligase
VILEVSSYQLEDIHRFHPHISSILNVTPDHLEHHGSMSAYAAAKARIFENQNARDICVLNADDAWCRRLSARCRARLFYFSRRRRLKEGIWMEGQDIVLRWGSQRARWSLDWELPGAHNIENALAAAAIAVAAGISARAIRETLRRFHGVEHRLETVRELGGVRYINDSKATNVDSTRVALESFDVPLIVIMGGRGKGAPYTVLRDLVKAHVRRLLLIGEDAPRIRHDLSKVVPCEDCGTMSVAVTRARQVARSGDVVLLSPACASFDQYGNYEERGREFKTLVRKLKGKRYG